MKKFMKSAIFVVLISLFASGAFATTNFLQWNPGKVNQQTDVQYTADPQRTGGAVSGVFASKLANKLFFQTTTMTAALGQAMSDKGYTVSDTDYNALVAVLANLVSQAETQYFPPTGALQPFAGSTAPTGWLLCYGQAVSRTTYANLFSVIGTTYGVGDGSTTFNVPDLRGRSLIGLDNMGGSAAGRVAAATSLGQAAGTETKNISHTHTTGDVTLSAAQSGLPAHTHSVQGRGTLGSASGANFTIHNLPPNDGTATTDLNSAQNASQAHNHGATGSGGSATQSIMNPYLGVNVIIRY